MEEYISTVHILQLHIVVKRNFTLEQENSNSS